MTTMNTGRAVRRNLAVLADIEATNNEPPPPIDLKSASAALKREHMQINPGAEMDRYMIALLKAQTEGRISYRRIMGIHGGGFGTSLDKDQISNWLSNGQSKEHRPLMKVKADLDRDRVILEDFGVGQSHNNQDDDDDGMWPSQQYNCKPEKLSGEYKYLGHIFCWHGQSPFSLWHRPLMVEFERLLQEYDPLFPGTHTSSDALGAHYYDWNGWDGMTLPAFLNYQTYKIKTKVFCNNLEEMNSYNSSENTITNPLYRWFAPMNKEHQLNETFPELVPGRSSDIEKYHIDQFNPVEPMPNCTVRDPAFSDLSGSTPFKNAWPKNDQKDAATNIPSIQTSIREAMRTKDFLAFCTTTHNGNQSIEYGHNLFHNRIGGNYGTMSPIQSMFDPIFLLHHSNVDRQIISWQKAWAKEGGSSKPPNWLMKTRLYPWTKPDLVRKGSLSWNTAADIDQDGNAAETTSNDATFKDWWDYMNLDYEYDEYVPITKPASLSANTKRVLMTVWLPLSSSGNFVLSVTTESGEEKKIDMVSLLTGNNSTGTTNNTTCIQCKKRKHLILVYDVTGFITPYDFRLFKSNDPKKPQPIFGNLFVRHNKVVFNSSNNNLVIKSVRYANKHWAKNRKELAASANNNEVKTKAKGFGWNCKSGATSDVIQ